MPTDLSTSAPGLESPGPVAVMHGLSCSAACGLPRPGVKSSGASSERLPLPQSCLTLCPPGSSVHRISQARLLEWVAISFSTLSCLYFFRILDSVLYTCQFFFSFLPKFTLKIQNPSFFSVFFKHNNCFQGPCTLTGTSAKFSFV